jgi:CDP-diacylglycerol--glycerol-3-phosphate 3-phosphatidyltransferase
MSLNLYRLKPASLALIEPLIAFCVRRRISPDAITAAALPFALIGAAAIVASPAEPALLWLVPLAAAARLICNLIDGAVARRLEISHPRGELLNELVDRLADIVLLGAPLLIAGQSRFTLITLVGGPGIVRELPISVPLVIAGLFGALIASYVGITAKAAGGRRLYHGILSKPGRMTLIAVIAPLSTIVGPEVWAAYGPLLAAGTLLTLLARLRTAYRELA